MKRKIVLEVGTFDATDTLKLHNKYPSAEKIYSFEPHPFFFQLSVRNTRKIDKIELTNKAVYNKDEKDRVFNECQEGGASSLLNFKEDEELIKHWGSHRTDILASKKSFTVDTTRLDTFLYEKGFTPDTTEILFVHIDAQGVDLEALESLGNFLVCVKAGCLETVKQVEKAIYKEQSSNTLENVNKFMIEHNFKIICVEHNDHTNCEFNVHFTC